MRPSGEATPNNVQIDFDRRIGLRLHGATGSRAVTKEEE